MAELDVLLQRINETKAGRQESDIELNSPYWDLLFQYQRLLVDGIHIPEAISIDPEDRKEVKVKFESIPLEEIIIEESTKTVRVKTADEQLRELGLL